MVVVAGLLFDWSFCFCFILFTYPQPQVGNYTYFQHFTRKVCGLAIHGYFETSSIIKLNKQNKIAVKQSTHTHTQVEETQNEIKSYKWITCCVLREWCLRTSELEPEDSWHCLLLLGALSFFKWQGRISLKSIHSAPLSTSLSCRILSRDVWRD